MRFPRFWRTTLTLASLMHRYRFYLIPLRQEGIQLLMGGPALQAECGTSPIVAEDGKTYPAIILEWGPPQGYPGAPILGA